MVSIIRNLALSPTFKICLRQQQKPIRLGEADQIRFSGLSKVLAADRVAIVKEAVTDFISSKKWKHEVLNSFARIEHFAGNLFLAASCNPTLLKDWLIFVPCVVINSACDILFHKVALKKSKVLVRFLKKQGITNEEELIFAIKTYLNKKGGIVYSKIFTRFWGQSTIQRIAQGENVHIPKDWFYKFRHEWLGKGFKRKRI